MEGATRANDKNERSEIEGEAPLAYASGGGDASPDNRRRHVRKAYPAVQREKRD
jgi:hypothetical protein